MYQSIAGHRENVQMTSPWASTKGKAAEEVDERASRKSAGWWRFRWLLKFVVFPPFVSTIFLHKRQMASSEFNGWPFSSAFRPKYNQALDLVLGLLIRSMSSVLQSHWMHFKVTRGTGKKTQKSQKFGLCLSSFRFLILLLSFVAAVSSSSFLRKLHYFCCCPLVALIYTTI